jgi:rubredoxin
MSFKPMDPDLIWDILEGHEDILTDAAAIRDNLYRSLSCPCCKSKDLAPIIKEVRDDELVPYHRFECRSCGCVFDPKTNLIIKGSIL